MEGVPGVYPEAQSLRNIGTGDPPCCLHPSQASAMPKITTQLIADKKYDGFQISQLINDYYREILINTNKTQKTSAWSLVGGFKQLAGW